MKIGISTACFFNNACTEGAMAEVKRLGATTTECFFNTRSEYLSPIIDAIADAADGLDVYSVHAMCTQFEPQLFARSPRVYADAHAVFDELLRAAVRLGSHHYTFHGALQLKRRAYEHDFDFLGERMHTLTEEASKSGITICYENVHYSYASKPDYFAQLLPRCPKLGTVLDVKQAVQSGLTYRDFLPVMKGRLRTVHATDIKGTATCLPSRGEIDWHALFCDLKNAEFDGTVMLEVYPTDYRDYGELLAAYEFLLEEEYKAK